MISDPEIATMGCENPAPNLLMPPSAIPFEVAPIRETVLIFLAGLKGHQAFATRTPKP